MEKEIAIKVDHVSKTFRIPHEKITSLRGAAVGLFRSGGCEEFKALDDVSFEVKKGEFFGIIGRNGSGKSTLLKILAGIYQTDKGKIHINGMISPFLELGIGFNPELSGRDNIYLNATVLGMSKKQIDEKFDSIVAFSELERFIDQKLKNYSSGMQVRLAFSVSIHANRDILLMDEVLAVGDSNFQSKCLEEFCKYRNAGKTVVLVTHDIATVQRYCDRVLLLHNGRVVTIGKAENVGNEYIHQNIADEERRIASKQSTSNVLREKENNKIKKIAEITRVEFLDENENEKNVFQTGDEMLVRVHFKQNKKGKKLNFGLGIYNQETDYFIGINTFFDKADTDNYTKNCYFQVNFKNIPLKTNSYYVLAGIWGDSPLTRYDLLEKSNIFKVFSSDQNQGLVDIKYTWA